VVLHGCFVDRVDQRAPSLGADLSAGQPRVRARWAEQVGVRALVGGYEDRYGAALARLGPHKTGKGCLYLKRLGDLDEAALGELIDRSARVARGVDTKGR
jgi:hypothetical protein